MTTTRDEWRWTDDRGVQRLVGTDELRAALTSALLPPSTLVWREGMKEWAVASTMPELADAVAQAPKGQTTRGRASLVGVLEALAEEATAHAALPARPKVSPAGPLKLPSAPAKRPQAPGILPRAARHTLIGGVTSEPQKVASQSAPIMVPSPSALRAAITQVPQQGTPAARFDALEIPKAPGLPQTTERPRAAPQRKMTTRELDGEWSTSPGGLSDEDATQPQLARPTREYPADRGAPLTSPTTVASEEAKPVAEKTSTALKPVGAAPRPSGPTITAPAKPATAAASTASASAPVRPAIHRPPVSTRPPALKVPSKLPPAMPGAKPFVFPAAPRTPTPFGGIAVTPRAIPASAARDEEAAAIADPRTEELDAPAAALPPVSPAPALPLDLASLDTPVPPEPSRSSYPPPGAARISPPPIPNGVTITTTALFATAPKDAFSEQLAARATHPSYPPDPRATHPSYPPDPRATHPSYPQPLPEQRPPAPSRPLPSLEPFQPAPKLAPAEPVHAPLPPPRAASRGAASIAAERAATSRARDPLPPPSTSLSGPVAVPVGSLYGAGGALICMVVTAFFAGRCSAQPQLPQLARPSLQAVPALARAAIPPPPKACWVTRQPVMWASKASKSIPFEVTATTEGALAIGYARDANEAMGIVVSPSTGEVKPAFAKQSEDEIDRVTPSPSAEFRLVTAAKEGAVSSVIPVAAAAPFVVGVQNGSLVTADREGAATSPLWPLAGSEAPSAARVQIAGSSGYALVFRREGAIWSGWIGPDRAAVGELVKVVGSGGQVGKPNIGWNQRELALIFADKPAGSDRYEIRVAHAKTGSIPSVTSVIPLPRGGPGGDAFAPDIAGLPDGRWVMVWTEGAAGSRAIRAQTFDHDFTPLGDPIALSPPAGNFGQGMLGVVSGYAAAVFLSKGASSYELWGSVLQCG